MTVLNTQDMVNLTDLMWRDLSKQTDALRAEVNLLNVRTERSEMTGGVRPTSLANAPLAANGASAGDHLWLSDCRKIGEPHGAGTGVTCYYDAIGDQWKRVSDDAVAAT